MKNKKDITILILLIINILITATIGVYVWNTSSNKNIQYKMYVGTNDKDAYEQIVSTDEAKEIIDNICFKYLDGYTIQDATGSWVDENGQATHENTIVCYFDDADSDTVYKIADEIIDELNQNTVLIEKNSVQTEFYSGDR